MTDQILQVALEKIDCPPQVREVFDEGLLAGLAANMKEVGQLQPIRLLKDGERYFIEDGERRYRAAKVAGFKTIAAIVESKPISAGELLLRQCSYDFQRADLSPMEKASAMERLMQSTGMKGNEVAAKLGVSPAMVSRLVALLTLPEPIRQALKEGRIPASAGYELAKIEDACLRDELARKLMEGKITRDGVAGARKAGKRDTGAKLKRITALLGGGRAVTVATAGETVDEFISVLEEALVKARRGRTQGFGLETLIRLLRDQAETA